MPFYELFPDLIVGQAVLNALAGLWRYRQLSPAMRLIAWLVCFDAATEVSVSVINIFRIIPGVYLFPVSLGGEGLFLLLAYRRALASPPLGRALLLVLAGYLAFMALEAWLKLGTPQYFVVAQVVCNLLMLALALLYFRRLLDELHVRHLGRDPFFWVSVGLVVYALGNLFIALSSDYILAHFSVATQRFVFRIVRNVFNVALYAAYFVALWMRPPKPSS